MGGTEKDQVVSNFTEDEVLVVLAKSLNPYVRDTLRCSAALNKIGSGDLLLIIIYGILAGGGLLGNLWVIGYNSFEIYHLKSGNSLRCHRRRQILTLILCLSLADVLVLTCLPLIITDMLMMCWPFGEIVCKMLWMCETPNKILSTFLLVALSCNCYLALYYRDFYIAVWLKQRCTAILVTFCILVAIVSALPVFLYADIYAVGYKTADRAELYTQKCLFNAPPHIQKGFSLYTFAIGFCLTSCLQVILNGLVIRKMLKQTSTTPSGLKSQVPFRKVTRNLLMLVMFYFICWTPNWIVILYVQFTHDIPRFLGYVAYVLPYLNSAVNPTLYCRINRMEEIDFQLSKKRKSCGFEEASTDGATKNSVLTTQTITPGTTTVYPQQENGSVPSRKSRASTEATKLLQNGTGKSNKDNNHDMQADQVD